MPKIAIITDTDSSLPPELAAKHEIVQVPIMIQFGDESLATGTEIDDVTMFRRVDDEGKLPTTAAPPPGDFLAAFEDAFAQGADEILCICISSALSTTYNAAMLAAQELPDRTITVVDSFTASMAQGFMVLAAAEAIEGGGTVEEAVTLAESVRDRSQVYAALDTLKYLAMSGRVGSVAAGLSGLLSIKPILSVQEGKLAMLEKSRTHKRSWQRVIDLTLADLGGQPPEKLCVIHVAAHDNAMRFAKMVAEQIDYPDEIAVVELTPGLSVHTGSGVVGTVFVRQ